MYHSRCLASLAPSASALTFVVQVLMGTGNETQELVYMSSGEDVSDASGEREGTLARDTAQ